jgi:hypothetical protein
MKRIISLLTLAALPLSVFAADITGVWKSEFDSQIGVQKYTYVFKQDGTNLTGKASSEVGDQKREAELKEGQVDGGKISFVEMLNFQGNDIRIAYTGKLLADGNQINFTREVGDFAKEDIVAKREAAAPGTPAAAIRIKAGSSAPFTDSSGNVWQADQGFDGGDIIERPDLAIANTKDAGLFQSEHYSMDSFSTKVPNGKYVAKLYFAETYDGITGPGQRVFSFNVQGHEFKDFDVWVKAGGPNRAYIETVPVEVTDGTFKITFTSNVENPQINAIEIIPQSAGDASATTSAPAAKAIRIKAGQSEPFTDSNGNVWLAEQGFEGGDAVQHDSTLAIANTKDAGLFQSEHYSMDSFSTKVPNGKYVAKLYFAETYDGITGPGQRVFSFNVQGHEFKDFDVWVKAGGPNRA